MTRTARSVFLRCCGLRENFAGRRRGQAHRHGLMGQRSFLRQDVRRDAAQSLDMTLEVVRVATRLVYFPPLLSLHSRLSRDYRHARCRSQRHQERESQQTDRHEQPRHPERALAEHSRRPK